MKQYELTRLSRHWILALCTIGLVGCAHSDGEKKITRLDTNDHKIKLEKEWQKQTQDSQTANSISLSIDQALTRAISKNMDIEVAATQALIAQDNISIAQLRTLPSTKATGTFTQRSNDASSSSESVLTGSQSLEPSSSSESSRRLYELEAQWNLIDAAIAYMDSKNQGEQALIAKERLHKIRQNIERDVVAAYWRSLALQDLQPKIKALTADQAQFMDALETASSEQLISLDESVQKIDQFSARGEKLARLHEETLLSSIELKSLINIPQNKALTLTTTQNDLSDILSLNEGTEYDELRNASIEKLAKIALKNRPELREAFLNENIAYNTIRTEILRSFPGLNLIYTKNYDSNKFLTDSNWINFSAALSQSLTDLLTLPARYKGAKNEQELAKLKRTSLVAAIIAQVHIARIRLYFAQKQYDVTARKAKLSNQQAKAAKVKHDYDNIASIKAWELETDAVNAEIERMIAYANMQRSIADFMSTMGLSVRQTETLKSASNDVYSNGENDE